MDQAPVAPVSPEIRATRRARVQPSKLAILGQAPRGLLVCIALRMFQPALRLP